MVGRPCSDVGVLWLGAHVLVLEGCAREPILSCWCALDGRPYGCVDVLRLGAHVMMLVCCGWAPI